MYKILYIQLLDSSGYTNEENVSLDQFMGEMNNPYVSKRGGTVIYILQFRQLGFIYKP